jgi:hypothetical protein
MMPGRLLLQLARECWIPGTREGLRVRTEARRQRSLSECRQAFPAISSPQVPADRGDEFRRFAGVAGGVIVSARTSDARPARSWGGVLRPMGIGSRLFVEPMNDNVKGPTSAGEVAPMDWCMLLHRKP